MRPNTCGCGGHCDGLSGYTEAPLFAWSGWRLRIPGGPVGGQYHGFIAADSKGWPDGHDEIYRPVPVDELRGLGAMPYEPWDHEWGGTPLLEGDTVSDYVYRSPGEVRPRANASGGAHVVTGYQTRRSAGYAVAPGNYKGLGTVGLEYRELPPEPLVHPRYCPSWGCGPAPTNVLTKHNVVKQPPPPPTPQPSPVTAGGDCSPGYYRDAAGNCTNDWHNPYSLYLPNTVQASPSDYQPSQGQPLPTGSSATSWFDESTVIPGVKNLWVAAGGGLAALLLLRGRK